MKQEQLFIIGILILSTLSISFFFEKDAWLEPDSLAFYNRTCLGGQDFTTPILSKAVFSIIPCEMWIWKLFHLGLILASISALYFFSKKVLKHDTIFFTGFLAYFLLVFLFQLEDDQLAFPLIIALSARLLSNPCWRRQFDYVVGMILITLLVWQGAYIPMSIIFLYSIESLFAVIVPLLGVAYRFITGGIEAFNVPHIGNELIAGTNFLTNDITPFLFLFVKGIKQKIRDNKNIFILSIGFSVLGFFIPKLAYYAVIPNIMMINTFFDDNAKRLLIIGGIIALTMGPMLLLTTNQPNKLTWELIDQAVEKQEEGKLVFNEWFVGTWFHYRGGNETAQGGYQGEQAIGLHDYYWLGSKRKGCDTIDYVGSLHFQYCP